MKELNKDLKKRLLEAMQIPSLSKQNLRNILAFAQDNHYYIEGHQNPLLNNAYDLEINPLDFKKGLVFKKDNTLQFLPFFNEWNQKFLYSLANNRAIITKIIQKQKQFFIYEAKLIFKNKELPKTLILKSSIFLNLKPGTTVIWARQADKHFNQDFYHSLNIIAKID